MCKLLPRIPRSVVISDRLLIYLIKTIITLINEKPKIKLFKNI